MSRREGMTVVIITHNSALTAMADRVIQVKNGAVTSVEHLRRVQGLPADLGRQLHILQRREVGNQIVELEDKAGLTG